MSSDKDPSDFYDAEYLSSRRAPQEGGQLSGKKPPSRAEIESQSAEIFQEIEKLKRAQEELERKRAALEESRRRRIEWETSRNELINGLTRAVDVLSKAEFTARQEAEQMAKAIHGLRDALDKVQSIKEDTWTEENYEIELTRALTAVENARQEWNSARLKFPFLDKKEPEAPQTIVQPNIFASTGELDFVQLMKIGLAFSLPIVVVLLIAIIVILVKF